MQSSSNRLTMLPTLSPMLSIVLPTLLPKSQTPSGWSSMASLTKMTNVVSKTIYADQWLGKVPMPTFRRPMTERLVFGAFSSYNTVQISGIESHIVIGGNGTSESSFSHDPD